MPSNLDEFLDVSGDVSIVSEETSPPDPYANLIGHDNSLQEKNPFDAFLDDLEAQSGPVSEETQFEQHDWKTIKEAIYEEDIYVWQCRRCFRQVNVSREETLEQACSKINLNVNCGEQILDDIHSS